jgi:hypothetical protein
MRQQSSTLLLIIALVVAAACGRSQEQAPKAAAISNDNANKKDAAEPKPKEEDARDRAVRDYIAQAFPGAKLKGINYASLSLMVDLVGVDLEIGKKSVVVDLVVRDFRSEDGVYYYKAEAVRPEIIPLLNGLLMEKQRLEISWLEDQLKETQSELEQAKEEASSHADEPEYEDPR